MDPGPQVHDSSMFLARSLPSPSHRDSVGRGRRVADAPGSVRRFNELLTSAARPWSWCYARSSGSRLRGLDLSLGARQNGYVAPGLRNQALARVRTRSKPR